MDPIAQQAFEYLNQLRANPTIAIKPLQDKLQYFKGKVLQVPGQIGLMTQEGPGVYQECIAFLQKQAKLPAFSWCDGLTAAAADHANDIGPKGITGHTGSDGSSMTDRIERYGEWMGHIGENISFGQSTGQDVILQLIVDDGVPSRGHRTNCFKTDFKLVGISSANHKQYKTTCVFDFAEEFTPNDNGQQQAQKGQPHKAQPQKAQQQPSQKQAPQQTQQQQPAQKQPQKAAFPSKQGFGQVANDDPNMPPNCIKVSTEVETTVKNGKKTTVTKKTYEMADGSTKQVTETTIQS